MEIHKNKSKHLKPSNWKHIHFKRILYTSSLSFFLPNEMRNETKVGTQTIASIERNRWIFKCAFHSKQ